MINWSSWAHQIYSQKCEVKLYQLYSTHYKAKINHAANKCMIHDHIMVLHILISNNNNKKHKTKEWSVLWFRVYCKLVHQRKTCCSSRSCMWCSSSRRRAVAQIIRCAEQPVTWVLRNIKQGLLCVILLDQLGNCSLLLNSL